MKTGKWIGMSPLLWSACWVAGCKTVDSTTAQTSDVYAGYLVTEHSATEARVDATLQLGDASSTTYLKLTGQDRLTAYVGAVAYPMQGYSDVYQHYAVDIPYPATDTELRVAFERGPADVSALDSTAIVPGLFSIASLAKTPYSRTLDPLEIVWAPSDPTQPISWLVYGACVLPLSDGGAMDSGQFTVPAGTMQKPPPPGPDEEHHPIPPDQCKATVDVTKSRSGHVDPAFRGGTFKTSENRSISFTSVP
jgi:hypothetical protein